MINYDAVPAALKARPSWVMWRYENSTKVPYSPKTGHKAKSTKPDTWVTYDLAVKVARARKFDGIGYVFSEDDPYTGIDLDDCLDDAGALAPWAAEIVNDLNSYTEVSPSGHGLKIWVEGAIPSSVKQPYENGRIEMYDRSRYFTVTGRHFGGTPQEIRNVNGTLTRLYEKIKPATTEGPRLTPRIADVDEHTQAWARKVLARAIGMVAAAVDGEKDDILLAAARLAAGAMPHISESEIETALFAAIAGRAADPQHARQTIRNGMRYGDAKPLDVPLAPPTPVYDGLGFACCPTHEKRLPRSKNGNGYKCRQKDASTDTGWCAFWWSGEGYIEPQAQERAPSDVGGAAAPTSPDAPPARMDVCVPRFQLYRMDDLRALPPVEWLYTNEVPASLLTIICGPSNAGKSFLAVDYALSIARSNPDRLVVYVAPEGGGGYRTRVEAWITQHGGDEPSNIAFVLRSVPLLDQVAVAEFVATIRPHKPILVVLDTLARCIVGGDENSSKDMGIFVEGCDVIRQETGAAVAVVHHTGKSGSYRGSSALYGACDSWIDVSNDDGLITVSCGKAKDWKPFDPRYLRMVERGESCVLVPAEQVSQRGAALTEGQRKVLETLALEVFRGPGAKSTQIKESTGIAEKTLFRVLSHLKKQYLVDQGSRGDPYTITPKGLDEIKAYHRALRESREDSLSLGDHAQNGQLSPVLSLVSSRPTAQLSTTVTSLSHPMTIELSTTVTPLSPPPVYIYIQGGGSGDSDNDSGVREWRGVDGLESDSEQTDLFPVEVPTPPALPAPEERTSGFKPNYARQMLKIGEVAGLTMHYRLNRSSEVAGMSNDQIIDLADSELGTTEQHNEQSA